MSRKENAPLSIEAAVAGYVAGIAGLLVGHPLDSVKVMLQNGAAVEVMNGAKVSVAQNKPIVSYNTVPSGISLQKRGFSEVAFEGTTLRQSCSVSIRGGRSLVNLYSGIGVPLVTVGLVQSLNFFLFDTFRSLLRNSGKSNSTIREHDSILHIGIAAALSGGLVSTLTSPLAMLKTKQQMMMWNMKQAIVDTWAMPLKKGSSSRLSNFYVGYSSHFLCDSFGRALFFTSYETLKRQIKTQDANDISILGRMISACTAGMLATGVMYPLDVLRSKIYCHSALFQLAPPSELQMAKDMYTKQGLTPFFRGFTVSVLRSGPVAAVALPIYDLALEYLMDIHL